VKHLAVILVCTGIAMSGVSQACAQMVILQADFDLDTAGAAPATNLPGDPDGDTLTLFTQGGTIEVKESYGGLGQQPLLITRQSMDPVGIWFTVDPDFQDCEAFNISWRSVLNSFASFCYFGFGSPNSQVMGSVEFRSDGVMSANSSINQLATIYSPGTPQLIEVRIDILARTLSVSIDGVPDPQGQDLRHTQVGGNGLRQVSVAFGLGDMYSIAVDDMMITGENCAGVAHEAKSWSAVKAMYR
jgi:hypothetical protein